MAGSVIMTDKQHCPAGVTILDEDGQPFATPPDGMTVAFDSSDTTVAGITVVDAFNIDITSGKVGTAVVRATVTYPDTTQKEDSLNVTVTNSAAGAPNFTPGSPVAEA